MTFTLSPLLVHKLLPFGLHGGLPSMHHLHSILPQPSEQQVDDTLALVPFIPTLPAIVLQTWAYCMDRLDQCLGNTACHPNITDSEEQVMLTEPDYGAASISAGPAKKKIVRLPVRISKSRASTPVATSSLRRSSRLNHDEEDEIQHVRLPYAPQKRRVKLVPEVVEGNVKRKLSVDAPPQPDEEVSPPIPIPIMCEWGLECNVPPAELTDEALHAGACQDGYR